MENNYLYGLTIQGIQSYIFETNKLKEIIGASEIIEKVCTTDFNDFLKLNSFSGQSLLQAAGNIRFLTEKETAQKIFTEFHAFLLKKTSSVPFSQAVVEIEDDKVKDALKELDIKLRGQRNIPQYYTSLGNMARSKYTRTGSFTCIEKYPYKEEGESKKRNIDFTTYIKLENWESEILKGKVKQENNYTFPTKFSELTAGGKDHWLALIHIDGNGMGNIIKNLLEDETKTVKDLSEFSNHVDYATRNAFQTAIDKTFINIDNETIKDFALTENQKQIIFPFRPLVLGGDDVTIIMRADFAIDFTETFLKEFEIETQNKGINNHKGLTACAGIAYVKEKFPFHYSAHLAEELCVYAKDKSGRKASCLHFHKVQDSIFEDYKDIQKRELQSKDINFVTEPYYLHSDFGKSITDLQDAIVKLLEENAPRNNIREWVDACFNNPLMAGEMKKRIKDFDGYLPNEKQAINYLTQLAIQKI